MYLDYSLPHNSCSKYLISLEDQMERNSKPDPSGLGEGENSNKTSTELFALALPSGPEIDWYAIEEPWTLRTDEYSSDPEGDPVTVSKEIIKFLTTER